MIFLDGKIQFSSGKYHNYKHQNKSHLPPNTVFPKSNREKKGKVLNKKHFCSLLSNDFSKKKKKVGKKLFTFSPKFSYHIWKDWERIFFLIFLSSSLNLATRHKERQKNMHQCLVYVLTFWLLCTHTILATSVGWNMTLYST